MGLSKRIKSAGLEPAGSGTDLTCGLKLMQNKKRSIAARSTKMNAPTATQEQLDVAIPPATNNDSTETIEPSQTATSQEVRGEHSPEALTPTSIVNLLEDDDGPTCQRVQLFQKQKELIVMNEAIAKERHPWTKPEMMEITIKMRDTNQQLHDPT